MRVIKLLFKYLLFFKKKEGNKNIQLEDWTSVV